MLPQTIPTLEGRRVTLRPFRESDAPLVQSVADDPLIPLITTVPTSGSLEDALAYIDRQHERLVSGAGYSFAIANAETDEMVDGLDNVVFVTEDRPADGSMDLFGLYEGVALTERDRYGFGELPDRIVLYREPLLEACADLVRAGRLPLQ